MMPHDHHSHTGVSPTEPSSVEHVPAKAHGMTMHAEAIEETVHQSKQPHGGMAHDMSDPAMAASSAQSSFSLET